MNSSLCKFVLNSINRSRLFSTSITKFSIRLAPNNPPNKTHNFCHRRSTLIPTTHFNISRNYSVNTDNEVDKINLKFAEAREEIESAMDSKETVYFNEEAECARAAVTEVLEMYQGLLNKLPESEKAAIQRAMGLKIEQLKAELQQLNE